jgi:hypothetical protein
VFFDSHNLLCSETETQMSQSVLSLAEERRLVAEIARLKASVPMILFVFCPLCV